MDIRGKHVLVVGMARSGIAAAQLLVKHSAAVTVNDAKPREQLTGDFSALEGLPVKWELGKPAMALLDGMDILVLSPGIQDTAPFVVEARNRGIQVMGELELACHFCPCPVVAVTGTNGKTTTVTLLGEMFTNAGKVTYVCGNVGYPFSLTALQAKPDHMVVAEVSSFQLETIQDFHPRAAALLNITEDHLDRHGTMAEYTRLKMRIFENMKPKDYAVLNADDPGMAGLSDHARGSLLLFSRAHPVNRGAWIQDNEVYFRLDGDSKLVCRLSDILIPGPHNQENALAAICMAGAMGVPIPVIRHTLRTFQGVEHRIEFVRELHGVRYINDSKGTNVNSTIMAIRSMDRPTVILLGGSDKHADFRELAMEIIHTPAIRAVVLMGETADKIEAALRSVGYQTITRAEEMGHALRTMQEIAREGWNALLSPACASFDMFSDYEDRGQKFKSIVMQLK